MLKTKSVSVKIGTKNLSVYDSLGYQAYIGEKCRVKVEDLLPTTNVNIIIKCDHCQKETTLQLV